MKETVLILSKTQMQHNQVCVGGLTVRGRQVRLLDSNGNNQPEDTDLAPGQTWKIEFNERPNITPPHVEDILVLNRAHERSVIERITIKEFIEQRGITIIKGSPDYLFDKLIQWTQNGSGYIDYAHGIPPHSVGFWISDLDLRRRDFKGVRYDYPSLSGRRSIKFKGLEVPVAIIPAGTLIRVSLARWVAFEEHESPKCWLQLSGWYDLGESEYSVQSDDLPFSQ